MNRQEAQAITARIRAKLTDPELTKLIAAAYNGRVWLALDYPTWGDWCAGELGGFKLPAPQRKKIVDAMPSLSNTALAEVTGVDEKTIRRDRSGSAFAEPDKRTGQDGKNYPARRGMKPAPPLEDSTPIVPTPATGAEARAAELLDEAIEINRLLETFETNCYVVERIAEAVSQRGPYGDAFYVDKLNRASAALTNAQIAVMSTIVEQVND